MHKSLGRQTHLRISLDFFAKRVVPTYLRTTTFFFAIFRTFSQEFSYFLHIFDFFCNFFDFFGIFYDCQISYPILSPYLFPILYFFFLSYTFHPTFFLFYTFHPTFFLSYTFFSDFLYYTFLALPFFLHFGHFFSIFMNL